MHQSPKLISFIALRANAWSLAEISWKIGVPKSTLWEWDTKHRDEILRLKQLQLEKYQQRFLPSYEEELARLTSYLKRIEDALEQSDFDDMHPGYLLQLALQLRGRLARVCSSDAARQTGSNPSSSATGCITRHYDEQFTAEDLTGALRNQTKPDETPPSPQT